jgi:hypothetical protein
VFLLTSQRFKKLQRLLASSAGQHIIRRFRLHALMLVAGITVIHAALFAMMLIFMSSGKGNVQGLNKAGE